MRYPLQRRSPADIDQVFGVHRRRERRMSLEEAQKLRERDRRDDAIRQRRDRIESVLEEASRKADKISGEGDVQNLAAAVVQYPVAHGDAVDQHEQPVIFATFGNDLPIAPDKARSRLNVAQHRDLAGRQRYELGKLSGERG